MEFLDYRPYSEGDDIRHVDPYILARTGDAAIRQYAQSRQLSVTIVVDASESMAAYGGGKVHLARQIAQVLAFVALAGGDRVQVVMCQGNQPRWSPRWEGASRADAVFDWVSQHTPGGGMRFADALWHLPRHLRGKSNLILLSDWWDTDADAALTALHMAGHEGLAVQILAPEEHKPETMGTGMVTMTDAENGEEADIMLDTDTVRRYGLLLAEWQADLQTAFSARHWQFLSVTTDTDISEFCLRTLRARGVLT